VRGIADHLRRGGHAAAVIAQPYGVQCHRGGGARGSTSQTYREGEAGEAASSLLRSGSARTEAAARRRRRVRMRSTRPCPKPDLGSSRGFCGAIWSHLSVRADAHTTPRARWP
jgi:hypothetical protein